MQPSPFFGVFITPGYGYFTPYDFSKKKGLTIYIVSP